MDENFTETINRESFNKRMETVVSMVNQMDRMSPGWELELVQNLWKKNRDSLPLNSAENLTMWIVNRIFLGKTWINI